MRPRKPFNVAVGLLQNFGTEARTAHTQQKDVAEILFADLVGEPLKLLLLLDLLFGDVEPSQPLRLVGVRPQ